MNANDPQAGPDAIPSPDATGKPKRDFFPVIVTVLVVVLLGALLLQYWPAGEPVHLDEQLWSQDSQAAFVSSGETGKPVLVLFTADWCGPCQVMKRDVLHDASVAAELSDRVVPLYADIDQPEMNQLAGRYGVRGIPHLMLLDEQGNVLSSYGGARDPDTFIDWLNQSGATGALAGR